MMGRTNSGSMHSLKMLTAGATADARDIYDGETAYVNGVKITGDMYGYGGTTPGEVPSDWPDIHAIVAADVQAGYAYKYIYLMADDYTYSTFTVTATDLAFKTSDGDFYTSTTTHNWDLSQDIATSIYKVRWVIVYSNTESLTVALPYEVLWLDMYSAKGSASGYSGFRRLRAVDGLVQSGLASHANMFSICCSLTRVPDILDLSASLTTEAMFSVCYSLTRVPDILDLSASKNTAYMFTSCYSLTRVPDILDLSASQTTEGMFNNCYSLTRVPDALDLSASQSTEYMFNNCYSLTRVPDILDLSACETTASMFSGCYSLTRVPDVLDLSACKTTSSMFSGCSSLTRMPEILDLSASQNASYMFNGCFSLTRIPEILDLSSCTSATSMFDSCYSLTRVPDILDLSACTTMTSMFYSCYSLTRVPDILNLSMCTNASSIFNGCRSLTRVPRLVIATASSKYVAPNFADLTRVNSDYKSTVATFDGGGAVNGGMVFNLATVTIARALTLNSIIKALFTAGEQAAIVANLTGKKWTLVW